MLIKTAGDRFELSTHDRFLRCPIFGEAHVYPWRTVEEWRKERHESPYFDTWSEGEGTREIRVPRSTPKTGQSSTPENRPVR